jgi:hypothetical protein
LDSGSTVASLPANPAYRTLEAIDVARLSGGKIVEQWGVADLFIQAPLFVFEKPSVKAPSFL